MSPGTTGKVTSTLIVGQEFIGFLDIPAGTNAGDLLFSVELSPLIDKLLGSRVSLIASSYGRFRLVNAHLVFSSSLAATQAGQIGMAFLTDPQQSVPTTGGGVDLIRVITDSAGSDVVQVWSNGLAAYPGSINVDPYYTNPLASDEYLTSAGQGIVISMIDSAGAVTCGSMYLYYEFEFMQPTLETFAAISKWAKVAGGVGASACTDAAPLGVAVPPSLEFDSIGIENLSGTGFDVPPGQWVLSWSIISATSVTSAAAAGLAAVSAAGFSLSDTFVTVNAVAGTQFQLWMRFSNTTASAIALPFGSWLTGATGDTIASNDLFIATDPMSFPTKTFGRSKKKLAAINSASRSMAREQIALEKEKSLLKRIEIIESSLQPSRSYQSFPPPHTPF